MIDIKEVNKKQIASFTRLEQLINYQSIKDKDTLFSYTDKLFKFIHLKYTNEEYSLKTNIFLCEKTLEFEKYIIKNLKQKRNTI
jgi:hypothetical protein